MRGSSRGTPHSRYLQPWQGFCIAYLSTCEMHIIHLVMNSACGQLLFHECSLQNIIMHSKHLDSFAEDTVMIEGTVCCTWVVAMMIQTANVICKYVKSSYRQKVGTVVKMEEFYFKYITVHSGTVRKWLRLGQKRGYVFFILALCIIMVCFAMCRDWRTKSLFVSGLYFPPYNQLIGPIYHFWEAEWSSF